MKTIICRTAFCQNCYNRSRPHSQELYLAYGASRNDYLIKKAQGNGTVGFTPHILRIYKVFEKTHVIYDSVCGICGVTITELEEYLDTYDYQIFDWKRDIIPIKEWNDWCLYKNDPDYLI